MVIDFNGKVAVVTGGTGGIGKKCAKTLLESGAKVVLIDLFSDRIKEAESELSAFGFVKGYVLDITKVGDIGPTIDQIRADIGEIEVLIQTAGWIKGTRGLEISAEEWDTMFNINARGMYFVMQQVVAQSMSKKGGAIVNFSSMAGIRGMNKVMASAHYSASKGAVVAMTMQGAVEWADLGIRVNAVAPGGVKTKAIESLEFDSHMFDAIPMGKLSEPQDIANCVTFLASDKASMITGQVLVIDGGSSVVGY